MDVSSRTAWFNAQLATLPGPSGQNFNTFYVLDLYEKLMSSLGKTGTFKNFQLNIGMLNHIITNHYATHRCIYDLSDDLAEERAQFFEPMFLSSFNKKGL